MGVDDAVGAALGEARYRAVFGQFLNEYWGAFHELLEAESVTPTRLAGSLVNRVMEQHRQFAEVCPATAMASVATLGGIWRRVADHRVVMPDGPLTIDEVREAREQFGAIYDKLVELGGRFPAAKSDVVAHASHSHPRAPLRADPAS